MNSKDQSVDMNREPEKFGQVCAVVVTYFPDVTVKQNLCALKAQVGKIVVVDNGSSDDSFVSVLEVASELELCVIRLKENLGIATALNKGLKFAVERGYEWLATFDQDSTAPPSLIDEMFRVLDSFPERERVAVISPVHVDKRLKVEIRERACERFGGRWRVLRTAMTSGNLVNVHAAASVGGYNESLFIDYVDHEFCLRLRTARYLVVEATEALLFHSLGRLELRNFLVKRVRVTNHPAVRRYYITRNRVSLWRQHIRREPRWVITDIRRFIFESIYILLYETETRDKFKMIGRGIRDAAKSVSGAIELNVEKSSRGERRVFISRRGTVKKIQNRSGTTK